jgi:hypothetical protein
LVPEGTGGAYLEEPVMSKPSNRPALHSLLAAALLMAAPLPAAAAAGPDDAAGMAAQKQTVEAMRAVGKALFAWVADQPLEGTAPEAEAAAIDWSSCPAISHDEAERLLVPRYAAALPRLDGWGRPLELCLRREPPLQRQTLLIGVRSAGSDGVFEGTSYAPGAFDDGAFDRDLVWLDGYFVVWPERR